MHKSKEEIVKEIVKHVRDTIGPVAAFKKVFFVQALPKTRSGKIPRSALANLVSGKPYKVWENIKYECACLWVELMNFCPPQITPTIEDPEVFKDIEKEVERKTH